MKLVYRQPNYFDELKHNSVVFVDVESYSKCSIYCLINENCVFFAYLNSDDKFEELSYGSCILKSKIDLTNGTIAPAYISTFNLISNFLFNMKY